MVDGKVEAVTNENLDRLENFPISFFSVVMGLSGFTIVTGKVSELSSFPVLITQMLAWFTLVTFMVTTGIYLTKILVKPEAVVAELKHPVKLSFFPAFSVGMILLSIVMLPIAPLLAETLFILGALAHISLFLFIVNSWMHHEHYQVQHISPAWFIPAVGNILVPIAGMQLGYDEVSWFFFSIGLIFWVLLFTIFFYRILFHNSMPSHLVPTFFILIAPPAVGFLAYVKLNGGLDNFAHILYFIGLFLTILLFSQIKQFTKLPFFLSWWAYSFPIAAITLASFLMYNLTSKVMFIYIASILTVLLTVLISLISFKTIVAIKNKKICVEAH